jgi:flagellar P-ring protein FlgI
MKSYFRLLLFFISFLASQVCFAARLKDVANVRGVRSNQLVGYGLVVGLNGTGDSKLDFTNKSMARLFDKMGIKVDEKSAASKNIAAVLVTATLPAFARAGNPLDITVNSIGDSSSLSGGTLIQTPLRGADQEVYAVAQGSILIGDKAGNTHLTVGFMPNGAIIEKDFGQDFAGKQMYRLTLHNPDFTTAARVAKQINMDLGGKYATAKDAGTIDLISPPSFEGKGVELLATIENTEINPDFRAKVVVNERTGTVVIGDKVRVSQVAISHGDLSVKVDTKGDAKTQTTERVGVIDGDVSVGQLVKAMNRLGVTPKDLIIILQNIKAVGALHAELEVL